MSWVLRRWLNPPTEEKSTPTPPSTSTSTSTTTSSSSSTPTRPTTQHTQTQTPTPQDSKPPLFPNNAKLLLGGLIFFSLSTLITRRTLIRKHLSAVPRFYTSSVYHNVSVNGAMDAFEALNIATINTLAASMIVTGGTLCVLDIDSLEGARARLRRRMGYVENEHGELVVQTTKEEEEQFEREMETWLASVLDKRSVSVVRRKVEEAKAKAAQNNEQNQGQDQNQDE